MTKGDALNLDANNTVVLRQTKEQKTVWKKPSEDPTTGKVIVWLNDGEEWAFHNEIDLKK